ncbi:MAG: hypothetical protein ACYSU7_00285 [Planctomycetota bacterium]|jgi:hypothetical protein
MIIHRPREKVAAFFVFLLPLLLVKGGPFVTGSGPAVAQATPRGNPKHVPLPEIPDPPTWSVEQRLASEHVEYLRTQPFGTSPLLHAAPPPPPDRIKHPVNDTRPEVPPPNVVVKAILTRSDGNHIALIGRKRYRVGDALEDRGWFITEIDGPARAVIIEHRPTKRTATLKVPLPR